jgi:uncharacterized membrane protein
MKNLVKKLLTQTDLTAIAAAIGRAEETTAGEIRVSIRQKRRWREKKLSIEAMSRQEFHSLGMTKTKDRTGVLIFLLLDDRKFFILADDGIHTKVDQSTWTKIADEISSHFSQNNFQYGIIHGVQAVGKVLSQYFPRQTNNTNELPNEVHVR